MLKLRIIDEGSDNLNEWHISIKFEDGITNLTKHYTINAKDFMCQTESLEWYYSDYLLKPFSTCYKQAQHLNSSMMDYGKSLADALFCEKILTSLEHREDKDLIVSIESSSAHFFRFPWETLSITKLNKPLSTLASAFVRTGADYVPTTKYLNFDIDNPLTVIFVSPRPQDCIDNPLCGDRETMLRSLLELGDAVIVEQLETQSFIEFKQRLEQSSEHPVHLVHFNGYTIDASIVFESKTGLADFISCEKFADLLSKHSVETVFLDVAPCITDKPSHNDTQIDTRIPQMLQTMGIINVITTLFGHYAVYAQRFYSLMLSFLAAGEGMSKAVVKARALMQENTAQSVLTVQPLTFLDWPLINHYSDHDVILFSEPLSPRSISESTQYQETVKNIIGFRQDFLASGFLGRSHEHRQMDRILERNIIAEVKGNHGVGKTHFVHHYMFWHMHAKKSTKAFYFDFRAHHYTKNTVLEIIYGVLNDKLIAGQEDKIKEQSLLLVLDNIDSGNFTSNAEKEELFLFLESAAAAAVNIIIVSSDIEQTSSPDNLLNLKGLNAYDRRQYACSILRQKHLEQAEEMAGYFDFIDSLEGHPFMMQILIPMLVEQEPDEVEKHFFTKLKEITSSQDIYANNALIALFEYGWDFCDENCRRLFFSFKNYRGYITEGMVISADKKAQPDKEELFTLLEIDKNYSLAKAFAQGCKIGLLSKKEFGYEIHPDANRFLNMKQSKGPLWDEKTCAAINLAVSKLFIAELRMLCAFISQHQDKTLYQIIIQNNSRWFNALTLLWQGHMYKVFNHGLDYFGSLLSPVGLFPALELWCLEIIKQQKFEITAFHSHDDYACAWLKAATYALGVANIISDSEINEYADTCQKALLDIDNLELFNYTMMFLEKFYRLKSNWQARKELSEYAVDFYTKRDAYDSVIVSLRSLAKCEEALGNIEAARKVEQKILEDIPFDSLGHGAKLESMLAVVMNKVHRKEFQESETLLNDFKSMPESESYHFVADMILADILFKKEQHIEAVHAYAKLWETLLQKKSPHAGPNEQALTTSRLKQLAGILGDEQFVREFRKVAPDVKMPFEKEVTP